MELKLSELEKNINYISYNIIVLYKNLAYYYLNTGLIKNVNRGKELLNSAIQMFEMGNFSSSEQFNTYFQLKLLASLTFEFFNKHNKAYQGYEQILHEIEEDYNFISPETSNLLRRLMYIISSENSLKKIIIDYNSANIVSVYQNKRRILEKDIYAGSATENQLLELIDLFKKANPFLDKLYHVTHYRLLYMFYASKRIFPLANAYFNSALKMANEYEFFGQITRLNDIHNYFER